MPQSQQQSARRPRRKPKAAMGWSGGGRLRRAHRQRRKKAWRLPTAGWPPKSSGNIQSLWSRDVGLERIDLHCDRRPWHRAIRYLMVRVFAARNYVPAAGEIFPNGAKVCISGHSRLNWKKRRVSLLSKCCFCLPASHISSS